MRSSILDAGCVTGRLQPLHRSHLELFERVLARHSLLIVGITNPDHAAQVPHPLHATRHMRADNPFTFFERQEFVVAALSWAGVAAHRYRVVPFPLQDPTVVHEYVPTSVVQFVRVFSDWERGKGEMLRAYGYAVEMIDGDPGKRISASDIRASLRSGGRWRSLVPTPVGALVDQFLQVRTLAERDGS